MRHAQKIEDYFARLKNTLDAIDRAEVQGLIDILLDAYGREATIFIMGNGGSAATASHFACDINKGACYGLQKRFRVHPLTDNMGIITAYSNDVSYDDVFVEQLRNFLRAGDVVIGISGSGNSRNVLKAIEYANGLGCTTVGMTGYQGGKLRQMAAHSVNARVDDMQISEDIHLILTHLLMQVSCAELATQCKAC